MELKRTLNFTDVFFIGYGSIVGAGIYTLLGIITKYGQGQTWISFIIGGIISLMTGLSYTNLSKRFDSNKANMIILNTDKRLAKICLIFNFKLMVTIATLALALTNYVNIPNINNNFITIEL